MGIRWWLARWWLARWWLAALALAPALAVAAVEPPLAEITEVLVDGQGLPSGRWQDLVDDPGQTLELSSCRMLAIRFRQPMRPDLPAYRLCYRLDGVDAGWRDIPGSLTLRLEFFAQGDGLKPLEPMPVQLLTGDSPGWTGDLRTAPLTIHGFAVTAPPGAAAYDLWFATSPPSVVGVGAIADLRIDISAPDGTPRRSVQPRMADAVQRFHASDGQPQDWQRRGSLRLTRLVERADAGHALGLVDDRLDEFGAWRLGSRQPVTAGESVRVQWKACHSVGTGETLGASYAGLGPGWYRFQVGLRSADGRMVESATRLSLHILPPPWKRPATWIAALASLVAATALTAFLVGRQRWLLRVAAAERRIAVEQERLRIARDIHDDLGSSLAQIAMIGNLARSEPAGSRDHLAEMVARAEDSMRRLRAIVWAVDPAYDAIEHLAMRLAAVAEEHVGLAGLIFRAEIPERLPAIELSSAVRHHLVLAVREAVHNAVRHARARSVTLRLALSGGMLRVEVADDGVGCDPTAAIAAGRGVARLRRRLADIDGACTLSSSPAGTVLAFSVPVPVPGQEQGTGRRPPPTRQTRTTRRRRP